MVEIVGFQSEFQIVIPVLITVTIVGILLGIAFWLYGRYEKKKLKSSPINPSNSTLPENE